MRMVGVLAFHGDFAEHIELLASMKVKSIEVRSVDDLKKVSHLIIPGGESTVMSRFLKMTGVGDEIKKRVKAGGLAVFGTCAGSILLARKVRGKNSPGTLQLMDLTLERNAYGAQTESFEAEIKAKGFKGVLPVAFIRAPVFTAVGKNVEILASLKGKPILVRQGRLLAGAFHPEIRGETAIHKLFLSL